MEKKRDCEKLHFQGLKAEVAKYLGYKTSILLSKKEKTNKVEFVLSIHFTIVMDKSGFQ
jgi:hypothetical protein